MNKHECYVVDGCVDFIPVKRSTLTPNGVEVTIVGSAQKERVLVDRVYQMAKNLQKPVVLTKRQADYIESFNISSDFSKSKALYYISRFGWNSWLTDGKEHEFRKDEYEKLGEELDVEEFKLLLITAVINGYEVEQEKLYTVEIPNPNSAGGKLVLFKQQSTGKLILDMLNPNINEPKYLHLTEAGIKQDFEWAWQWAKEVE